ncbi:MAG: T9SS type A sorting domain-containing protein [Bacteroidia bacterium]|nr:T9SS type A sorting domain-containing protein [Bacteroidia bacterium]
MRKLLIFICLFFVFSHSRGQTPVGTWTDHLVYSTAKNLAVGSGEIYANTGSSLIIYNKEYAELRKFSRVNGLTETAISTIAWSEENKALLIAYSSANIDILKDNLIYNIPDISRKYFPGKKEINRIRFSGKYEYLACSFGIVVIDIIKQEIYDTWKPGNGIENPEIWDIAFGNGKVYAATGIGVYSADLNDPGLAYFGNWSILNSLPEPTGKYTAAVFSGDMLYVNQTGKNFPGDNIYMIGNVTSLFSYSAGVYNIAFDKSSDGFSVASGKSVRLFHDDGTLRKTISSYTWGALNASQAIEDQGDIWIADINSGLIKGENMSDFSVLTLPGPISNNAISVTSYNGKAIICGGGVDNAWNNLMRSFQISIYENHTWTNIEYTDVFDAMRAFIDPADESHFFISSWGGGLFEYKNNDLINRYKDDNSPLQTIVPGGPYVRICGLAMDSNRNLWIAGSNVPGTLKALKPDNDGWIVNPATWDINVVGDLIMTRNGTKWAILPRGNGLFILDDNDTPEYFDDDMYKQMFVTDPDGKMIGFVYCLAEDLEGNIWVGTDQGPLVYYNPDKVFEEEIKAFRIKIPRNDGSGLADLVLFTESIASIAIDGANRKWLGTASSGAYLLSSDGTRRLRNYNEQNSPILSNNIASVAVDNETGDVWFVTSQGIISVRGDATEGKEEFSGIYSFPNPVREDYEGNVIITGLMKDTQIKITDISGNLVYQTFSDGGQASWDLKTYNGLRVATGVYLVFCASSDGSQTAVTKILVIN